MTTKTIDERTLGHRPIAGTDWPVRDLLTREQIPGRRPQWQIVRGLCNGVPTGVDTYSTRREALEAWRTLRLKHRGEA